MSTLKIAIDPGVNGGIAWGTNRQNTQCEGMPETRRDLINLFRDIIMGQIATCVAYLEKVAPFIPDAGASMMFEFGKQAERPGCIIETMNVRLIEVTPQNWQKALQLGNSERQRVPRAPSMPSAPKGSTPAQKREFKKLHAPAHNLAVAAFKQEHGAEIASLKTANAAASRDWKRKLKGEAQRRFPSIAAKLDNCDALLILDYSFQQLD